MEFNFLLGVEVVRSLVLGGETIVTDLHSSLEG
jgi:hypothetical protein